MLLIADLHLHSKYSRAVSPEMVLPKMAEWGRKKGINLLGTGDFTHPLWFREIKANLEETGEGIYQLKNTPLANGNFEPSSNRSEMNSAQSINSNSSLKEAGQNLLARSASKNNPSFLLSTEISSIYSQGGKLRRIHQVVLSPSVQTVEKINQELERRGCNLHSDGRPIIGISAKDLVKIILEIDERSLIIPAHAWTPWFSLYGSLSGFDSLSECYGDMSQYIYGVETGLSSDPGMNWRIKDLENRSLVSFSDAHSGPKLGREATVFTENENEISNFKFQISNLTYEDIAKAIKQEKGRLKIGHTLEFYPEEGKYHYTGHRACGIKQTPEETKKLGTTCPTCGKKLTVGVMHRVDQLANQQSQKLEVKSQMGESGVRWIFSQDQPTRPPYAMLVPLQEIIAEALETVPTSIKVQNEYEKLINDSSEFGVLLKTPIAEIVSIAGEKIGEGIRRVRAGEIFVDPGYDGVFGVVKIWNDGGNKGNEGDEGQEKKEQMTLF